MAQLDIPDDVSTALDELAAELATATMPSEQLRNALILDLHQLGFLSKCQEEALGLNWVSNTRSVLDAGLRK